MIQIENALTELVKSYIKAEPNRSRGGIVALTGFEYQIWSYLADYALALSTNELLEGGQQFANAFETLSDYTLNSEMGIICVQVKHHLERRDMANAAAEFATIERFLESHPTFNLSNQFTYQVVARTGAKSLDWATIQLPQNIKNYQELCLYFDKIRGSGRLLTSRFEPDPHWKLIAAVYKHLADPFDFARRAFALCMRRTQEPNSAEFVRNTIAEDYKRGSRKHQPTSQPLSMSDFSRDPDGSGISLAKTPKISDLRCGRFMKRSERIADILVELDDIRKSNQGLNEPAISVLWINGRSGCGKSVLLLEIMEYLVVESQASVIWFANGTEEVGTIIDQMTKSDTSLRPDFLVVDDIYDPQARDSLDLPRLIRLIVHSDITTWPILITCGPTEFMQDFQSDSRAEGFRIIPFHLSTLEPTETTALQNWYHSRTGRLPELGFASTEQHALMISVMFELEYGDLKPFAYRFRQRLVQNQLDNVLNIPLALNRLYIWTPRQWLTPEEEERLERLNQDGDFSILSIEGKEQILFKLTHPHLSDAIYRALHPGATPVTFARHLVAAFSRALSSHLPTAVRLLRTVASNLSRLEIVDEKELANGMTTAWNTNNKVSLSPGMEVEMWINWAIWAARQPVVSTSFSELPLKTAIDMLYREHSRWSSLWLRLWMCALGEPALTNCALKWLASHFRDDGWQFVWYQVTKHLIQCARIMNVADDPVVTKLCLIGLRWSKKYTRKSGWSRVWEQLTDAPEFMSSALHDEVLRIGIEWTRENSNSVDWNFVWEKLAKMSHKQNLHLTSDEIYVIGSNWLKEHVNHPGWPFVWEHFIALSSLPNSITHQELLQMGITWISGRENDPGWGFIVLKLAEKGGEEDITKVVENMIAWLEQHLNSPRWLRNWYNLFEIPKVVITYDQRRRVFSVICEWIAADDEREHMPRILARIMANLSSFPNIIDEIWLVNRVCDVLSRTANTDDRSWTELWFTVTNYLDTSTLVESATFLETLRTLGLRWLGQSEHLSDGTWHQMYQHFYHGDRVQEVPHRNLAVKGIVQGLISESARFAAWLYSTPSYGAPPDELLQWLNQWFSGSARETNGFSIWMKLDRATHDALAQGSDGQWMKLRNILDIHRPNQLDHWKSVIEHYRQRQPIVGRIVKIMHLKKTWYRPKGGFGYMVDIGMNALLTLEEAGIQSNSKSAREAMIGQTFEFDIIRLDELHMQVDLSRQTLVHRYQQEAVETLSVGAVIEGTVKIIKSYGVIVDLGFIDGLLHISEMCEYPPKHPSELFEVGQHLVTKILDFDVSQRRVSLTIKPNKTS